MEGGALDAEALQRKRAEEAAWARQRQRQRQRHATDELEAVTIAATGRGIRRSLQSAGASACRMHTHGKAGRSINCLLG